MYILWTSIFLVNVHYTAAVGGDAAGPAGQFELFFDIQYLYLFHIGVTCGAAGGARCRWPPAKCFLPYCGVLLPPPFATLAVLLVLISACSLRAFLVFALNSECQWSPAATSLWPFNETTVSRGSPLCFCGSSEAGFALNDAQHCGVHVGHLTPATHTGRIFSLHLTTYKLKDTH